MIRLRMASRRMPGLWMRDDRGSAPVEFLLVSVLLVLVAVSVVQLALALHVRNTLLDAAAEGARFAALAGNDLDDGVARTNDLIGTAIGPAYSGGVTASYGERLGFRSTEIRVSAPLPLLGLIGPDRTLEVAGHAAVEELRR
jgi:hypothetical protein